MTAITAESTMLFEYGGVEDEGDGKRVRYFAVFATPVGRIQAIVTRDRDPYASPTSKAAKHRAKTGSSKVQAKLFTHVPAGMYGDHWCFVAALGPNECMARELSVGEVGSNLSEDDLSVCRADAARVVERALLVIAGSITE